MEKKKRHKDFNSEIWVKRPSELIRSIKFVLPETQQREKGNTTVLFIINPDSFIKYKNFLDNHSLILDVRNKLM